MFGSVCATRAIVKPVDEVGKWLDITKSIRHTPNVSNTDRDKDLAAKRRQNLGRLLGTVAADFHRRVIEGLRARGFDDLRYVHNVLLMNMGLEGTRHTVLAQRAGVSRQAIGQLVDELEALGYVERADDPDDGRAQLVRFTRRGRQVLETGMEIIAGVETDYAARVGKRKLAETREVLAELVAGLGLEIP
jgi:DNA-binding MarR family transcriptional regulator